MSVDADHDLKYNLFISHASEDKEDFVRPLVALLRQKGLKVWFDEEDLLLGDNLRESIDKGLSKSLYGVVICSHAFFSKGWTQAELEASFAKESEGNKFILPIRHNISVSDIKQYSPLLAGKVSISSEQGPEKVAEAILKSIGFTSNREARHQDSSAVLDLQSYRQQRIRHWEQKAYELDKRFIQLVLLLDHGLESEGPRFQASQEKFDDLWDLLQKIPNKACVLMGRPGCGKSTVLRYLDYQLSEAGIRNKISPLPFYVELNRFPMDGEPMAWLKTQWQVQYPQLPPLLQILKEQQCVWFLLDAINEMAYQNFADYCHKIEAWRQFLVEFTQKHSQVRFVFSCRSLDYSATLSDAQHFEVPHIKFESLSAQTIQAFLQKRLPEDWETLWTQLEQIQQHQSGTQEDLITTPFYLDLQVKQYLARQGQVAKGPAELIAGMVWLALEREIMLPPLKDSEAWLSQKDRKRLATRAWIKAAHRLPKQGQLMRALITLATKMQTQKGAGKQILVPTETAQQWIQMALNLESEQAAEDLLNMGWRLDILSLDMGQDTCAFQHQLLQEYFAAQGLVLQEALDCLYKPWQQDTVQPNLVERINELGKGDPLQGLPTTGWEETCIHAAAISLDSEVWIEQVAKQDLVLAARCVGSEEVQVSQALKAKLSQRLQARSQDWSADIRARFDAGLALGNLEDTRFVQRLGPDAAYIVPPLVSVSGGTYCIGSETGEEREKPVFKVELPDFKIGQFPVTNREFNCFIEAGAYEDEQWWDEASGALAWQRGEREDSGNINFYRQLYQDLRADFEGTCANYPHWTEVAVEQYKAFSEWTQNQLEDWLLQRFGKQKHRLPLFWEDSRYNNSAQPVVGVSWFEASAYCAWLSAQSGLSFGLPHEAYWEAAARGQAAREFSSGEVLEGNTYESHWRQTTPIGIYPGTPEETSIFDLAGNCWEWTANDYQQYPLELSRDQKSYGKNAKVLRGGSFSSRASFARASYRDFDVPGSRGGSVGFRLLLLPPSWSTEH